MARCKIGASLLMVMILVTGLSQQASYQNQKSESQIDSRVREYISPSRIVWQSDSNEEMILNAPSLLSPGNGQSDLEGRNLCTMIG